MTSVELEPYPRYKESGVEWIGNVPVDWDVAAIRHRYSQRLGKMLDTKRNTGVDQLPYLRNTDVQWDRINVTDLPTMEIPPHEYDRYTVQAGDLLVCEGGEVGRCALWSGNLTKCGFQKALHRLRPRNAKQDLARYMYYALSVASNRQAFNDGHLSTIAHLTGEKLRTHPFPFPSFAEQAAIVRFLDHADQRIMRYIRGKQKLIGLLEEQTLVTIYRVITGQIDVRTGRPYLAYKPSGVEWIGDIPKQWQIEKMTQVARQETGHTPSRKIGAYWVPKDCVIPWVSLADVWQLRSGKVLIETTRERVSEVGIASSCPKPGFGRNEQGETLWSCTGRVETKDRAETSAGLTRLGCIFTASRPHILR